MKVLHVDTATEWRGGQAQLARFLGARPGDAWAGVPGSPLAARVGPPTVALRPGGDPRNVPALRAAARGYDLVAAHTPHAHGLALLTSRPLVVHRRVDFAPKHPWKYRPVGATIAVSEAVAAVLARSGVARVFVVHDGVTPVPVAPPLSVAGPRPVYGAAGALVDHKGHASLIDAMVHVPGTLLLAGEGPLRGALAERIVARGLGDRVRLLGQLPTLGPLFTAIDAFIHPSLEEGMGQVVVEAMAAGCRVVATTAGGLPEVVGDAGVLVPPADPPALAAAMRKVLARPAGEGAARAAGFSVARMVAGTEAVYARVLCSTTR